MADELDGTVASSEATENATEEKKPDPLAKVMARLDALETKNQQLEKVNSRKEAENQRLRESIEKGQSQEAMTKAMLAVIAAQTGRNQSEIEEDIKEKQPDLLKQYERIIETERKRHDEDSYRNRVTEYQDRAVDLGLTEDDGDYGRVFLAVSKKDWGKADRILNEVETKKQPPKEEPKEVKPDAKSIEEAARKLLEGRGQLRTEVPNPSKTSQRQTWTMDDVRKMDIKEYIKNFPAGLPDVTKAIQEGRVKVK